MRQSVGLWYLSQKRGQNGSYLQVLYDSSMQQLIADNLPAILALRDNSKA